MNISIETKDDLSAVITINIRKEDYSTKVDKILNKEKVNLYNDLKQLLSNFDIKTVSDKF